MPNMIAEMAFANDNRDPFMARGDCEDHSGLALEAPGPQARSRAVSVQKQCRFVVGLSISWIGHRATAHPPKQGAGPHAGRRTGRCCMSYLLRSRSERKERKNA